MGREIKVSRLFEIQTVDQFQVPVVRFITVLRKRHGFATFKELLIALVHLHPVLDDVKPALKLFVTFLSFDW